MKKSIDITKNTITFIFDGTADLTINPDEFSDEINRHSTLHGYAQKIGDGASGIKTDIERRDACFDVFQQLLHGVWNRKAGGGLSILLTALTRLYPGKEASDIRGFLEAKSDKEKRALAKNGKVALMIAEIKAERAGGSGEGLLDELEEI